MYKLFPQAARHSLTRVAVQSFPRQSVAACVARRHFTSSKLQESSDSRSGGSPTPTIPSGRDPAWLSKLQKRVKQVRDQASGSTNLQQLEALDNRLSDSWLELSAGREGFLTESRWRGLDKHPIQWGDADSMVWHVNNVIYNKFAESARVNWVLGFASTAQPEERQEWQDIMSPKGTGLILKSIKMDFKLPMRYPDSVTVIHKLAAKPNYDSTNVLMDVVMYSEKHQRVTARAFEDIVVYDYSTGKKTSPKRFMIDELVQVYNLQEQSKQNVEAEIADIERMLKTIESD